MVVAGQQEKKADVQQRYDRGTYRPTINVKWMPFLDDLYHKFESATATSPLICATCGAAKFYHVEKQIAVVSAVAVTYRELEPLDHKFKPGGTYTVHEFGDDSEFWAWVHEVSDNDYSPDVFEGAYEIACEQGWEDAKELANDIFPPNAKVWSDGRSGGWLVVDGLPDVDDWDAIQLGYWSKFVKGVQCILDDLDYQFIWHLNVNVWEPHNEQAKKLAERMVRS